MPITFVGAGTPAATSSGTPALPALPAGLADDDIVLAIAQSRETSGAMTGLKIGSGTTSAGFAVDSSWTLAAEKHSGGVCGFRAWWKRKSGTLAAPTFQGNNHCLAALVAFRGCLKTASPIGAVGSGGASSTASAAINLNKVFPDELEAWLIAAVGTASNLASFTGGGWANIANGNEVEQVDYQNAAGTGGSLGLWTAGPAGIITTSGDFTATAAAADQYAGVNFALLPEPRRGRSYGYVAG